MRKFLSILLCLCILFSLAPTYVSAAEEEIPNEKTMEMFGFKPDPASFRTDALRPGSHPIDPKYDLYVDYGSTLAKSNAKTVEAMLLNFPLGYTTLKLNMNNSMKTTENQPFFVSTGFAATSTGVDDHIAKIYFPYGKDPTYIFMSIYDSKGNAVVTGYNTGAEIISDEAVEMWEIEGLLSVTAGDFDGDSVDEIAVYTPNNMYEYIQFIQGKAGQTDITVSIFEFDADAKSLEFKDKYNIGTYGADSSCYNNKFKFYYLPYVSLCAEDFNGDGYDDLAAVVNYSTWYKGRTGSDTYSTAQIIDPNVPFASLLEVFEGSANGKLKRVIEHKVMVTEGMTGGSSNADTKNRFILRNANITVGDVTAEGSREIIIAGNYTRASVANQSSTSKVTSNRFVEVDHEGALCHIVGYTTYDNLKRNEMYNSNTDYHWTIQKDGNGWTFWYQEDPTDSGPVSVSLCAYKHEGIGYPDTIFVGGQYFKYNSETGVLEFQRNHEGNGALYDGSDDKTKATSVVWIGGATAGNLSNDMFGRETLIFPFYFKVKEKEKYNCKILTSFEKINYKSLGGEKSHSYSQIYAFEDSASQKLVSFSLLDGEGQTGYLTYDGNNTDVYYSDVEVLAIMQAPPLYGELNDGDYIGNSGTSFAKSESSTEGIAHGGSLTAGVVTGFEQETSFLGLFKCAGAEYELSITGTASYEKSTETTYSYTSGFSTSGTTDTAVVFTVPYVRYNCSMYVPEYKLPTEDEYTLLCRFANELKNNINNYVKTAEAQPNGNYVKGCSYYLYKYSSYVNADNYQDQLAVLDKVLQEIDFMEKAIEYFDKGGTGEFGGTVTGAVLPYHYNVPQQPMVTTVDVATYDSIADVTPGLDKIYGNVFNEGYTAGDPTTYAHTISNLNAVDEVLQSKQSMGGSEDGFLTNSNISSGSQSQSISVEKATSNTIGWGAAIENTSTANVGGVKAGFTVSAEYNGSSVKTTTEGNEYEGEVVALPDMATADYSYGWKLVAYNAKLNGGKVPVVGYLTKMTATPPPSIATDINIDNITDRSVTLSWTDGTRPASYYKLSRVYPSASGETILPVANNITSTNGEYSYTVTGLTPREEAEFIIESYDSNGKKSIATDKISVLTYPENFAASLSIDGIDENVLYRNGKMLNLTSSLAGNNVSNPFYKWEMDNGKGWEELDGKYDNKLAVEANPLYNENKFRLCATFIADGKAYIVYSNPLTLHCAITSYGYNVDWDNDENAVTVNYSGEGTPANVFVKAGDGYKVSTINTDGATIDIKDAVANNEEVKVFLWTDGLKPVTTPFAR